MTLPRTSMCVDDPPFLHARILYVYAETEIRDFIRRVKIENIQPNTKLRDGLFIRVSEHSAAGTCVYDRLFS